MNTVTSVNNDIKFLAKSETRLKILNELNKNPNSIKGLVEKTKMKYSSVSLNVGKLEKNNYITKMKGMYYVNPMTKIYFKTLMDFKKSIEMINEYEALWNEHNLNNLSINSIKQITDLKKAKLIEATPIDIYKTHEIIKNQFENSKTVRAIFPYIHPEYHILIENILRKGGSIELIIPENIFKAFVLQINGPLRRQCMKTGQFKAYKFNNELNLYLTICDKTMSLGLFKNDGSFDQNRILVSNNAKSYKWADELYTHVKKQVMK